MIAEIATSFKKSFESSRDNRADIGTQYFSDPDLFYSLGDSKCGKTKQTKTGNENSNAGKSGKNISCLCSDSYSLSKFSSRNVYSIRYFREKFFPCIFKCTTRRQRDCCPKILLKDY